MEKTLTKRKRNRTSSKTENEASTNIQEVSSISEKNIPKSGLSLFYFIFIILRIIYIIKLIII